MQQKKTVMIVAVTAIVFGIVTLFAGARVLLGADPGYVVYLPLLYFNTLMGVAYVVVGIGAWKGLKWGVYGAGAVCVFNLIALGTVGYLFTPGGAIANTSVLAMSFRASVWLVLLWVLARAYRGMATERTT